jgi:hypothetical protein
LLTEPSFATWATLVAPPSGNLFGEPVASWREQAREELRLPNIPLVVVGHQPEIFHPGILAKFIAGECVAAQVGGALVHLVVDHHLGTSGTIDIPNKKGARLTTSVLQVANLDTTCAMRDQPRVTPVQGTVFTDALANASGENAAMQFANATDSLMSPYVTVAHCIAGTSLLKTSLGNAIVSHMLKDPDACITTYNYAVSQFPNCGIDSLDTNELPLWQMAHNEPFDGNSDDLRPRALLLTLLARLAVGDLFVHGTGGYAYDAVMELWVERWLGVSLCAKVMATADVRLTFDVDTIEDERNRYFDAPKQMVDAIENAPYQSAEKRLHFLALHKYLEQKGHKPDTPGIKKTLKIAHRRDWAFPLYDEFQLMQLKDSFTSCAAPRL